MVDLYRVDQSLNIVNVGGLAMVMEGERAAIAKRLGEALANLADERLLRARIIELPRTGDNRRFQVDVGS